MPRTLDSLVGLLALAGAGAGLFLLEQWAVSARVLVAVAACSWVSFSLWGRAPVVTLTREGFALRSWWGAHLALPWSEVRFVCPTPFTEEPSEVARELVEDMGLMELSFVVDPKVLKQHSHMQQSYFALLRAPIQTTSGVFTQLRVTLRCGGWAQLGEVLGFLREVTRVELIVHNT